LKVSLINHSDIAGGAARAAYRIHHALRKQSVASTMFVNSATADDWTVKGPETKVAKALVKIRGPLAGILTKTLKTGNPIIHSPAVIPSHWHKSLNSSDADVVHLHWVNGEMISIADIGRILKPVVWTLHDMWAFCGAEHVTMDHRWRDGYTGKNRPDYESGFDLNRWTAAQKLKHWTGPIHIVTPSCWLAECARKSVLMRDWPVSVIPNTIDTNIWQPIDKALARQLMHLPPKAPILLFGALGGTKEPHKGFDLLQTALGHLRGQLPGLELVVLGQLSPKSPPAMGFPAHYIGHLLDDVSLRLLYSAADVTVIPSRLDNFPNAGVEAHACGTPVVAFDTCGLPDIVEHKQTGYLAHAFDPVDMATGLQWVLNDSTRLAALGQAARNKAVRLWSPEVVSALYLQVYRAAIAAGRPIA
jgi:glycosyltransferase involved in cell wall biosynthesis